MNIITRTKLFTSSAGKKELHAIVRPAERGLFGNQLAAIFDAVKELEASSGLTPIMVRYFLSDAANQAAAVRDLPHGCAVSVVEQRPLGGEKVAAWIWLQEGVEVKREKDGFYAVKHGAYTTLLQTSACEPGLQSSTATRAILGDLALKLDDRGGSMLDNCLRTWLFVRDVDVNYAGVVAGRNELFALNGLSTDTHFIASTGINGAHEDYTVKVQMDSLSCLGIKPEQVRQLEARTHLNPTSEYGVAFERATAVDFGDRRHVLVSGTASINNKGEVVHVGDITRQTERMIENVGALLAQADCDFSNVGHLIVYLRDIADRPEVEAIFADRFPDIPYVLVHAPVCRPTWLIEMECMAFKPIETGYAAY
ncbi:MAG: Rid family hydrolase [Bacteroides sp.]|nr:Rid family hydrolase [Bacteroides sp.]MCM1378583.1 Rid family hydrolase [Bacteroides sp.]MCM1444884.1 Rid family hydrolase [Prevotella sp.]